MGAVVMGLLGFGLVLLVALGLRQPGIARTLQAQLVCDEAYAPVVHYIAWQPSNGAPRQVVQVAVTAAEQQASCTTRVRHAGAYPQLAAAAVTELEQGSFRRTFTQIAQQTGQARWAVAVDFVQSMEWRAQTGTAYLPNLLLAKSAQHGGIGRQPTRFVGDCDDSSLLLVALLRILGYDAALWDLSHRWHMAVVVHVPHYELPLARSELAAVIIGGRPYYFVETTCRCMLGYVPPSLAYWRSGTAVLPARSTN